MESFRFVSPNTRWNHLILGLLTGILLFTLAVPIQAQPWLQNDEEEEEEEPAPAEYTVSLDHPGTIQSGNTLTVTTTVENTGEQTGTPTIEATLGDQSPQSKQLEVPGGETDSVEFNFNTANLSAGEHEISVTVDGEESTNTVSVEAMEEPEPEPDTQPAPASFEISAKHPSQVTSGMSFEVNVTVSNTGGQAGSVDLLVELGPQRAGPTTVELPGGESVTKSFSLPTDQLSNSTPLSVTAGDNEYTDTIDIQQPEPEPMETTEPTMEMTSDTQINLEDIENENFRKLLLAIRAEYNSLKEFMNNDLSKRKDLQKEFTRRMNLLTRTSELLMEVHMENERLKQELRQLRQQNTQQSKKQSSESSPTG